jgi:intraflagellar transport protein 88
MLFAPARGSSSGQQRRGEDEDMYSDFDYSIPAQSAAVAGGGGAGYAPPGTAMRGMPPGTAFRAPGTAAAGRGMVPGTAAARGPGGPGDPRPMTSVAGAGYQSKKAGGGAGGGAFDPLNAGSKSRGPAPALAERADNSPEEAAKEQEKQVHKLLEASALAGVRGDAPAALEKAKEADKREKALCKHRERHGLVEQINLDLTYAVCFALATCYHSNGMRKEALREYSAIVKNKQYPQAGRLRANMGNIYFEQADYLEAIKCYRMALDQIPNTGVYTCVLAVCIY